MLKRLFGFASNDLALPSFLHMEGIMSRCYARMFLLFISIALSSWIPEHAAAAASCSLPNNPDYGANIGFQYVAQACAQGGKFVYNYFDLNCNQSSQVEGLNESVGSTPRTPDEMQAALINYLNAVYPDGSPSASYKTSLKMFRNFTGSSFIFVVGSYSKYNQSIDGKNMGSSTYAYWPTFNRLDFNVFNYPSGQTPPCCLTMAPTSSPRSFKPSMDEKASFFGNISSNYPISWLFSINGSSASGSGSGSYTWSGKDANGFPLPAGVYSGTFSATSATCSATGTADINIVDPPKQCPTKLNFGSTADVTTGNLSFNQELFSTRGGTFPLSFSLNYNSLDTTSGPISQGWRHSYDIMLLTSGNGRVLFEGGKRHVYTWSNGAYVPEAGDTSLLNSSATEITFVDGHKYTFNANGTISTITDKNGNILTFAYTDTDLTTISDGWRTITLGYDTGITPHRLTSVTDPNQNEFTLTYQNNFLWKVINPITDMGTPAGYWEYTYTTGNLLQTKKDPGGNTIQYGYSGTKVNSSTDPNNKTRGIVYPTTTEDVRTTTFTEKDGGQWQYTYDIQSGFLKEKTLIGGKKTSYYYNSDTTLRAKTEPFDNNFLTTFYTYDQYGNQLTQTDPVNISTYVPAIDPQTVDIASLANRNPPIKTALRYTYDPVYLDQIASVTDERFTPIRTTTYQYSTVNGLKVTTVTDPEGKQAVTRENANGTIAEVEDGNGKKTVYTYYPDTPENRAASLAGQLESITGPDNVVTRYTFYDLNGNPEEIIVRDAAGRETTTVQEYDALNRLRKVTRYAAGFPDNITRYGYDNNGNRNSVIDPENHETKYEYNFQGQVTKVTDARLKDTTYEYGATGCPSCSGVDKLTAVVDARLKRTSYQYNTLGQLERETDPLNKVIRYTYYDNGLLKEKIDTTIPTAEVVLITHYYDTQGHLTKKHYADGSEAAYTYYPDGALWTAANQYISYTYTYYNNGWLKSVSDSNGRTINYDLYDNIGQKKTVNYFPTTSDAKTVTYGYDGANRLETVTSAAGTFTIGYDNLSRRKTVTYPNLITATYGYDDLNRLTSLSHAAAGGGIVTESAYTHDQAGNRKTKTGTVNESYIYDEIYRLTDTVTPQGTEKYTYDDVGNRKSGPGTRDTEGTYQYNDGNQLINGRTLSFLYDNMGNQTTRIINNAPEKEWTLT